MTTTADERKLIGAAIFSAILAIVGRTKLIFKFEPDFNTSNPYMKIGRTQNKNDKVRVTIAAGGHKLIDGGHFVGHLGFRLSDKTHIQT